MAPRTAFLKHRLAVHGVAISSQSCFTYNPTLAQRRKCLYIALGKLCIPVQQPVLQRRHIPTLRLLNNLCREHLLLVRWHLLPSRQVHLLARLNNIPLNQPRPRSDPRIHRPPRLARVAIRALLHQLSLRIRRHLRTLQQRAEPLRRLDTRIPKRMHIPQAHYGGHGDCGCHPRTHYTLSASFESPTARSFVQQTPLTLPHPTTPSSLPPP